MAGFNRKLRRESARKVMKENNISSNVISKKVRQYCKLDKSLTIEHEQSSINVISLMHLLELNYFGNEEMERNIHESESCLLKVEYDSVKRIFYTENRSYKIIVDKVSKMDFYKNSINLLIKRNAAYFNLIKEFEYDMQILLISWLTNNILGERYSVFGNPMYSNPSKNREDASILIDDIVSLLGIDEDSEATIKSYIDKFLNIDGFNYSKNLSENLAKKYNSYILDIIKKLGLSKHENKMIKFASELYNRTLEVSNTTRLFEDIYTIHIKADKLFITSYYLTIAKALDREKKNWTKPQLLKLLKENSNITDDELSVVNSLMNYKENDKSLFTNSSVFYTKENLLIMIFAVSLMSLPLKDEIIDFVASELFSENKIISKNDLVKESLIKYLECVKNLEHTSTLEHALVDRTYYYTYKVEIDFLVESSKLLTISDMDNMLRDNKIYKKYKSLIEF